MDQLPDLREFKEIMQRNTQAVEQETDMFRSMNRVLLLVIIIQSSIYLVVLIWLLYNSMK